MLYRNKNYTFTKTIVIASLLLSIAIIVNYFTKLNIPIGTAPVVRVALGGPFLRFIGILFGPAIGGIAPAISDVIGFLLKPTGGYIWPLTLVAFLKGFTIAFIWHAIKKVELRTYNIAYVAVFLAVLVIGIINLTVCNFFPSSVYAAFILNIGKSAPYATMGLIMVGCIGLFVQVVLWFILGRKSDKRLFEIYLKLIVSIAIPSLLFTTVNTYILIKYLSIDKAFIYFWIPRLFEEMLAMLYAIYVTVVLCTIYERAFGAKMGKVL